jgi:hypothetical protein
MTKANRMARPATTASTIIGAPLVSAPQEQLQQRFLGGEFTDASAKTPVLVCEPLLQIDAGGKPGLPAVERRACHAKAPADRLDRDALYELPQCRLDRARRVAAPCLRGPFPSASNRLKHLLILLVLGNAKDRGARSPSVATAMGKEVAYTERDCMRYAL